MRRYESLFIIHPDLAQEGTQEVLDKFQQIITRNNGKVLNTDPMGIRKLSFDIKKQSRGFYVLMDYASGPELIKELERNFRIDERVLNYQTIKLQDKITDEEIEEIFAKAKERESEKKDSEEEQSAAAKQDAPVDVVPEEKDVPPEDEEKDLNQSETQIEKEQPESKPEET